MKKSVLLYLLIFIFSQMLFAQPDSLYDLFPLTKGMQYTYTYQFIDTLYHVSDLVSMRNDSGSVNYTIKDSILNGNEINWLVEQKEAFLIHYVNPETDTTYWIEKVDEFNLIESLNGNHQVSAYPPLDSYNYINIYSPWYLPTGDSIYRYRNTSAFLTLYNYYYDYDSLWFDYNGLYKRITFISFEANHREYSYTTISLDSNIVGILNQKHNLPELFNLSQNYPNPFNPSTTINYEIPKSGLVTIKIYDVLGREVETLVNEEKNSGKYKVEFDGSKLSSGVYFYKITTNNFSETKKMLLMK